MSLQWLLKTYSIINIFSGYQIQQRKSSAPSGAIQVSQPQNSTASCRTLRKCKRYEANDIACERTHQAYKEICRERLTPARKHSSRMRTARVPPTMPEADHHVGRPPQEADPPTDRITGLVLKILPCPKLSLLAVKIIVKLRLH